MQSTTQTMSSCEARAALLSDSFEKIVDSKLNLIFNWDSTNSSELLESEDVRVNEVDAVW